MTYTILLGPKKSDEQEKILLDVCHHLDSNKFSCTFSIINNNMVFDCDPYSEKSWTEESFKTYASEVIIKSLCKKLL